jgi:hypothetical protein
VSVTTFDDVSVNGVPVTAGCSFALSQAGQGIDAAGGVASVNVTAARHAPDRHQ